MDEETLNNYIKAGKIAAEALQFGKELIKPGSKVLDVCLAIDKKIIELGGELAFPSQISLDDAAAHYCPDLDDKTVFEKQVCCLDVGVHVNGFIGDNALTVDLSGENEELVKASRDALNAALRKVGIGVTLGEIGKEIHDVITSYGFSPIRNLSGHGLGEFDIHTTPTIPNFDTGDKTKLEDGMAISIEPFATKGEGVIYESGTPTVFQLTNRKPVRNPFTRNALKEIEKLNGLPFAKHWLQAKIGKAQAGFALRELKQLEILREYPPLVDRGHGLVSQAEHTVIVLEKPIITTKI
ncbi:type II methionyl aminopeptidase [Candidatus Woesearchaeota archaeon]|nr:type II methionyl aminopeptidase [Candidatus Woesearchaeota archaeon]